MELCLVRIRGDEVRDTHLHAIQAFLRSWASLQETGADMGGGDIKGQGHFLDVPIYIQQPTMGYLPGSWQTARFSDDHTGGMCNVSAVKSDCHSHDRKMCFRRDSAVCTPHQLAPFQRRIRHRGRNYTVVFLGGTWSGDDERGFPGDALLAPNLRTSVVGFLRCKFGMDHIGLNYLIGEANPWYKHRSSVCVGTNISHGSARDEALRAR